MTALVLMAVLARAEIVVDGPVAVADRATVVVTTPGTDEPAIGVTVRVIHRPGLDDSRELVIGTTDARGRVYWEPGEPGVVRLKADSQVTDLAVPWATPPAGALTLLALLGGAGAIAILLGLVPTRKRPRPTRSGARRR